VRNLSTSISVVLGGVIFQNQLAKHASSLAAVLPPDIARQLSSSNYGSTTGIIRALAPNEKRAVDKAYTESLQKAWIFYTAISAVGIVISLAIKKKELDKERHEVRTGLAEQERVRLEEKEEERVRREAKAHKKNSASWDKDVERVGGATSPKPAGTGT
jgi:hypothetical protein